MGFGVAERGSLQLLLRPRGICFWSLRLDSGLTSAVQSMRFSILWKLYSSIRIAVVGFALTSVRASHEAGPGGVGRAQAFASDANATVPVRHFCRKYLAFIVLPFRGGRSGTIN